MVPITKVKCEKEVIKSFVNVINQQKRKLQDRKHKCDTCGRMFLNDVGLNIHKKRMHALEKKVLKQVSDLSRSDSVKYAESVKSPPPKKIMNITKAEEIPLPEDTEDIDIDIVDQPKVEEFLRIAKEETVDIKKKPIRVSKKY